MSSPSENIVKVSNAAGSDDGKKPTYSHQPLAEATSDVILDSIDELTVKADGIFTIGDYGTDDGFASMSLMTRIVGQIRKKHGDELPVQIIYEDQEKNDFNSLFAILAGDNSVTSKFTNVYTLATNVNFYKQCVPDNTYDVILSSFATHWKEKSDVIFKDAIYHESPSASQEERQRFLLAAAQDWVKFLLLRAKELKPGGLLVVQSISKLGDYKPLCGDSTRDSDEASGKKDCPGSRVGSTYAAVFSDLEAIWLQLKEEKIIEREEYERCTINVVFRSSTEIAAPLQADESPVVKAGLSLVYHDQVVYNSQRKILWQDRCKEGKDNRDSLAQNLMECVRGLSHSSFEGSLSSSRSVQQKAAILDELYDRFRTRVASKNPDNYYCNYIFFRLLTKKN